MELSEKGIRYLRPLQNGESVFMGNLAPVDGKKVTGEVFSMSSAGYKVIFESDRIFDHITFWSNHRVACIEPFISYCLESGEKVSSTEYLYGCFISGPSKTADIAQALVMGAQAARDVTVIVR